MICCQAKTCVLNHSLVSEWNKQQIQSTNRASACLTVFLYHRCWCRMGSALRLLRHHLEERKDHPRLVSQRNGLGNRPGAVLGGLQAIQVRAEWKTTFWPSLLKSEMVSLGIRFQGLKRGSRPFGLGEVERQRPIRGGAAADIEVWSKKQGKFTATEKWFGPSLVR